MRVLVSVGTHEQPFQRLLDEVARLIVRYPDVEWVVQYGQGSWVPAGERLNCQYFAHAEMTIQMEKADVMISQASPGNVYGALEQQTWPIVVGRRHNLSEHVDDHQLTFAKVVSDMGLGLGVEHVNQLQVALESELEVSKDSREARCRLASQGSAARRAAFNLHFWKIVDTEILGGNHRDSRRK